MAEAPSALDLAIVGATLAATFAASLAARRPRDARGYFLADGALRWPVAALSLAASEAGFALPLVLVPWAVFRPGGGFGFVLAAVVGALIARAVVAAWVLPRYFERGATSAWGFVAGALGPRAGRLAVGLYAGGTLAAQAARLALSSAAIVLLVRDPAARPWEHGALGEGALVAAALALATLACCWRRGVAAAAAGDVVAYAALLGSAAVALHAVCGSLEGGFELLRRVGIDSHKIDLVGWERHLASESSLWAALLAGAWTASAALGVDATQVDRLLACGSLRRARLALFASAASAAVLVLAALFGVGLFAYVERNPGSLAAEVGGEERLALAFFADSTLPGVAGAVAAGLAAGTLACGKAALVALGHALADLRGLPARGAAADAPADVELARARRSTLLAALALLGATVALGGAAASGFADAGPALGATGYVSGALLAAFLLACLGRPRLSEGWTWSAPVSLALVLALDRPGAPARVACALFGAGCLAAWWLRRARPERALGAPAAPLARQGLLLAAALIACAWVADAGLVLVVAERGAASWHPVAPPWYVPLATALAFALAGPLARPRDAEGARTTTR